jgi:methylglutaconyl-CoA hydratase
MSSRPVLVSIPDPSDLLTEDRAMTVGVVRILTLHRPRQRNALDTALLRELILALETADRDDEVRAVVVAGHGRIFCAGGDLKEFVGHADAHQRMVIRAQLLTRLLTLLPRMSTPVIAAVTGAALGAGAALALAADLMVVGDDLVLGYPEITDSVVPAVVMAGAVHQLGQKLAFHMLTQGRKLNAQEALEHGLAVSVANAERTLETAVEVAEGWTPLDPRALSETKRLFYRVADLTLDAGIQAGLEVTTATWSPRK